MVRKLAEHNSRLVWIGVKEKENETIFIPEESTGKGKPVAVGFKGFYNPLRTDADIDCDAGEARHTDTCGNHALLCGIDDSEG